MNARDKKKISIPYPQQVEEDVEESRNGSVVYSRSARRKNPS